MAGLIDQSSASGLFMLLWMLVIIAILIVLPVVITALVHIFYLRNKVDNPKGRWFLTFALLVSIYAVIFLGMFVWGRLT